MERDHNPRSMGRSAFSGRALVLGTALGASPGEGAHALNSGL